MELFAYRHQIHFADTMAYGTHHFLTNFKFQCLAREALLFLREPDGSEPWRAEIAGIELLTQQGYSRNLRPVGLGDWVAVLLTAEVLGIASFRLCFRVVAESGDPVSCGYQIVVCSLKGGGGVARVPDLIAQHLSRLQEHGHPDFAARVLAGGPGLKTVFSPDIRTAAKAVAAGTQALGNQPFVTVPNPPASPSAPATSQQTVANARLAFLCPGQGVPDPGYVQTLSQRDPALARLVDAADALAQEVVQESYYDWLRNPEGATNAAQLTCMEQLTHYLVPVMSGRLLEASGHRPDLILGHSLGEIAALALSGCVSDTDGLGIVARRTQALLALPPDRGGLVAVEAGEVEVRPLVASVPGLFVAVANHPSQTVVAGGPEALERCLAEGRRQGLAMTRLTSRFPFHSPLLLDAVAPFGRSIEGISPTIAQVALYSPMERSFANPAWHLPSLLASHLIRPLAFRNAVEHLNPSLNTRFVECARHNVLARMVARIQPQAAPARTAEEVLRDPPHGSGLGNKRLRSPSREPGPRAAPAQEPLAIVAQGCCLPGAPDVAAYARLIESDVSAIVPLTVDDLGGPTAHFYADKRRTPDKTYSLLSGHIDALPPAPPALHGEPHLPKVVRLAAAALAECRASMRQEPESRLHLVVGSTADGCGEYDLALAIERLRDTTDSPRLAELSAQSLGQVGASAELNHHHLFGRVGRALFGTSTQTTVLDAACASSLYAIDVAARLLVSGAADVVLTGGAFAPSFANNCLFAQFEGLSVEGSHPLDARADGVVFGEGAAFVALKRLSSALAQGDRILGVIRGVGLSSDGRSPSVSAPKAVGQRLAIARAYQRGHIDPGSIQYIETHGTGTRVGDSVEFGVLKEFFGGLAAETPLALGSVKSQIGHTGWVAGAASLLKVIHFLSHARVPAQHGFERPNPDFGIEGTRFTIPTTSQPWPPNQNHQPRRAAINGFGFGGTNSHVVVEAFEADYHRALVGDAPPKDPPKPATVALATARHGPEDDGRAAAELLPPNMIVLPDVLSTLDATQLVAVRLAWQCLHPLGDRAAAYRETAAVVVSLAGKTHAILKANDRVFADRLTSRLRDLSGDEAGVAEGVARFANQQGPSGAYTLTGGMPNVAAGRVCQLLGLNGPNLVIDESAGARFSAGHYARSLVADGSCDLALVLALRQQWKGGVLEEVTGEAQLLCSPKVAEKEGWQPSQRLEEPAIRAGEQTSAFDLAASIGVYAPALVPQGNGEDQAGAQERPDPLPSRVLCLTSSPRIAEQLESAVPQSWQHGSLPVHPGKAEGALDIGPSDAVVLVMDLLNRDARSLVSEGSTREREVLEPLLALCKGHYAAIGSGALAMGVVCVGAFVGPSLPHPETGLVGGFVKSLGRELAKARLLAVHTDGDLSTALHAVVDAWRRPAGARELFVQDGRLLQHALRPVPTVAKTSLVRPRLDQASVVLVSGGGRGITAELVSALLSRFGCRVVLLGRSDPEAAPHSWRNLQAEQVDALEAEFHRTEAAAGQSLRDSKKRFQQLGAAHEVWRNLQRLRQLPGQVDYEICDVTDAAQVRRVVDQAVKTFGRVDLLLHGAGVQTSSLLSHKPLSVFWNILDTKLGGLRNLLTSLESHPESRKAHIHLATSAFSYFGNDGQQDYGAANEAMNRLADCFATEGRAAGTWTSLAWLAWDGIGMTRGSEYRTLAKHRRLRGIRPLEGGEILTSMLSDGSRGGAHVLLTENERRGYGVAVLAAASPEVFEATQTFSTAEQKYLLDHRVDGRSVAPACMLIDAIVTHAQAGFPDLRCRLLDDCRLHRFVHVPVGRKLVLRFRYRAVESQSARVVLDVEVTGDVVHRGGAVLERDRCYATCRLELTALSGSETQSPSLDLPEATLDSVRSLRSSRIRDPYLDPQSPVELGPAFDCLEDIVVTDAGNRAVYRPPALGAAVEGKTIPALVLDAMFRLGVVGNLGVSQLYVPVSLGRIQLGEHVGSELAGKAFHLVSSQPERSATGVFCRRVEARFPGGAVAIVLSDYAGQLRARLPLADSVTQQPSQV